MAVIWRWKFTLAIFFTWCTWRLTKSSTLRFDMIATRVSKAHKYIHHIDKCSLFGMEKNERTDGRTVMINFYFPFHWFDSAFVCWKKIKTIKMLHGKIMLLAAIPLWQILCGLNVFNHKTLVHCTLAFVLFVEHQLCLIKCIFNRKNE